jgi:trimethylamine--corrinoid protein Co-methyltransferase
MLTPDQVEAVHRESLRILREVGVRAPNKEVLDRLRERGATVDYQSSIVKMPESLVMEAVQQQIKSNARYYAGSGGQETTQQVKMWMAMGTLKYYFEPLTVKRREGTLRDLIEAIVVGNHLENVEKISCFGIPREYHNEEFSNILRHYLLLLFSQKRWLLTPIEKVPVAKCAIEMAEAVAENETQLRNGSLVYYELEPIHNLEYSSEHLEILVELARRKMTAFTTHWCWMGYHTPLTYAALLALGNANILAGITTILSLNPENMYLDYLFPMHIINKKYQKWFLHGSPHQVIISFLARQLADYYGFQYSLSNCGFSDALDGDFQMGFERGVTTALSIFGGIDRVGVQGILGADAGVSLEQLIIDNELLSYLNFILRHKVSISEELFDFETIKRVGPGGNFLEDSAKALRLEKTYWNSEIFAAEPYENYKPNQAINNVRGKLREILQQHFPPRPVIDAAKIARLDRILERYSPDKKMLDSFRRNLAKIVGKGR